MSALIVWNGVSGTTTASKTLSVTAAVTVSIVGSGTASCVLEYTLDGSTWTQWISTGASVASASYSVAIATGTNLANVAVRASTTCSVSETGGSTESVTATIDVSDLLIS
jgi:hypothetical protein